MRLRARRTRRVTDEAGRGEAGEGEAGRPEAGCGRVEEAGLAAELVQKEHACALDDPD